ncbi:MAG: DUF1080 domain-containing protein, partial [Pirellulales bacterium]|nr:DUF1080 domain-containing protein [Pirellulales bacterium]
MARITTAVLLNAALCIQSVHAADNQLCEEETKEGWILLFDGKSPAGWITSDSKPSKRPVEDSTLNPHKCGAYMLVTERQWDDYILKLDYKQAPRCNSGVFFRVHTLVPQPGKDVGYNGLEIAIDDTETAGYVDSGAVYDLSHPSKNASKPIGQWNQMVLTVRGNQTTIELNGEKVNEVDFEKFSEPGKRPDGSDHKFGVAFKDFPKRGRIGLQDHGADIWFKNIKLRPLNGSREGQRTDRTGDPPADDEPAKNQGSSVDPEIWERPLMAQEFDRGPVHAVRVPHWLQNISNYCYGAILHIDKSEKYGVQMTELAFGDPNYFAYPTKYFSMDPNRAPDDMAKQVADVRRRGMRVIAAFTPCYQREAYAAHPDWRLIPD